MGSINSPTPDATTVAKGKIQLAGDLSGTAASPKVTTSNGVAVVTTTGSQALTNKDLSSSTNILPSGSLLQAPITTATSAVASGSTQVPIDDTIPQSTEGDQYMTATITPKSTTSILEITVTAWMSLSAIGDIIGSIFQDSGTSAIYSSSLYIGTASGRGLQTFTFTTVSGTTSATTFKYRAGPSVTATATFNGISNVRFLGAVTKSTIVIKEYKP